MIGFQGWRAHAGHGEVVTELAAIETRLAAKLDLCAREVRTALRESIAALRAELIKWSFVFFATAALAVTGLR